MVEQQRGEGTEAHEDRRHVRLDMLLPPGNQQEWQAGAEQPDNGHHDPVSGCLRQPQPGGERESDQQDGSEDDSENGDQQGTEGLQRHLDAHEG